MLRVLIVLALTSCSWAALELHSQNLILTADIDFSTTSLTLSHSCGTMDNKCRMLVVPANTTLGPQMASARVGDPVDVYGDSSCNPTDFFLVATETKGEHHGAAYSACGIIQRFGGIANGTKLAKGNCRPAVPRVQYSLNAAWKFSLETSQRAQCSTGGAFPTNRTGEQCLGLKQVQVADQSSCEKACCNQLSCTTWQWQASTSQCWTGSASSCTPSTAGWVGGGPAAPPPAPQAGSECNSSTWAGRCSTQYKDSSWRTVASPHDFIVEGNFSQYAQKSHGYLPLGTGWYRKTFIAPQLQPGGALATLRFEGTMGVTDVWMNGIYLGRHASGYTPHEYTFGPNSSTLLWGGTNIIAIRVDSTLLDSWWYDGGGLYRDVSLSVTSLTHIATYGVYAPSLVTGQIVNNTADATIIGSAVVNNLQPSETEVRVAMRLFNASGATVAEAPFTSLSIAAGGSAVAAINLTLKEASLWSPQTPSLYTVRVVVEDANYLLLDSVDTVIGVRQVQWSAATGFSLNGKQTKILGAANHQDFGGVGVAVPRGLQRHRIQKLKDLGMNAWRTAHNAPDSALLDAADEIGFLVWDENHHNGQDDEMRTLVLRDRNHPSVIIWSLCNEVLCETHDTVGDALRLKGIAKQLDPLGGRPVAANNNGLNGNDTVLDLQGFDYATQNYDAWHARAPNIPAISSETSSAVSDRGEYTSNSTTGHVSGYDTNAPSWGETAQVAWAGILERPFIAGGFTWTGWDYKGEPTPYAWPDINSHFGILDIAGFMKDRAYWYRATFDKKTPQVHLLPHWNWELQSCSGQGCTVDPTTGQMTVRVWAYTNAEQVSLLLPNGTQLPPTNVSAYSHAEWMVPYVAGNLTAVAMTGGKAVATSQLRTAGVPSSLRVTIKDGVGSHLASSSRQVVLVQVQVVDANGVRVPAASQQVTLAVSGPGKLLGTSNGDPASLTPDHSAVREAYHGLLLGVVTPLSDSSDGGVIEVTASAIGLASSTLRVSSGYDCMELAL